jgi:hypothetical protein
MSDEQGREQRKRLELLQGRAKEARQELEEAETPGFTEQLRQLNEDAAAAEKNAGLLERDARTTAERLAMVRHDVEEAERQLQVPRTVGSVSPAVSLIAVGFGSGALWLMMQLATSPDLQGPLWVKAAALGMALVPPPLLAWLWRRRLSGGGTFRSRS